MGLRSALQELKRKALNDPPPIPSHTKPGTQSNAAPYWQPNIHPDVPVSTDFKHELGSSGWGNNESQNYVANPENSFYTDGGLNDRALVIHAIINHSDPDHSNKFTSARLSSYQTLSRRRGCLSARITAPAAKGIWPAFWLLPADPFQWPNDGEIDIMETWNGNHMNHSCLHWGHYNGQDWNKHRVIEMFLPRLDQPGGVRFDFTWDEDEASGTGRLLWYIDGKPVMKASKPPGTRPMRDFRILINVAVGGNVCQGQMPTDGTYELVVRDLAMWDEPLGGWESFSRDWNVAKEGKTM